MFVSERVHPYVGGLERHAWQLSHALAARGLDVSMAARTRVTVPLPMEPAVPLTLLKAPRPGRRTRLAFGIGEVTMAAAALAHIRRVRPQVVHLHGLGLASGLIAAGCAPMGVRTVGKVAAADNGEAGLEGRRFAGLRRQLLRRYDAVVATTAQIADALARDGVPPSHLVRLPNFVDTDLFRPPTEVERRRARTAVWDTVSSDDRLVAFVGRLDPQKNPAMVVELVAGTAGEPGIRAIVAGAGPLRADLEALAARRGVSGRIRFTGLVAPLAIYHAADLFVLPSVFEGMPNAALEAAACGLPVVASRIGGVTDSFTDAEAVLVPPDGVAAWTDAVRTLAADDARRRHLGEAARAAMLDRHRLPLIVDRYVTLYERLIRAAR